MHSPISEGLNVSRHDGAGVCWSRSISWLYPHCSNRIQTDVHRNEGADILILARTDARQAESLEEALWRAAAFADAGADLLFIDALESVAEMEAFTGLGGAARQVPKVRPGAGGWKLWALLGRAGLSWRWCGFGGGCCR